MSIADVMNPVSAPALLARVERIPISAWHVRARLFLGLGIFFDAIDLLAITYALPAFVGTWKLTPPQVGLILSAAFVGQLLGAILAGWAAERYGRLPIITLAIGLFSLMSLGCALAWDQQSLMIVRFIQGVGLGGVVPIANTYINEIARAETRGRFYILYQLIFAFGLVGAGLLGYWMVPTLGWQSMFYLGTAPIILVFFIMRVLPESPRWLISKGRLGDADRVVSGIERDVVAAGRILPTPGPARAVPARDVTRWTEMFHGIYRHRTFSVWALWYCCFSMTYGLQAWLPTLYRTVFNLPLSQSLLYGLITAFAGIIGSGLCAFLVDSIGRRPAFTACFLAGGVTLLTLWAVGPSTAMILLVFVSIGSFFMSAVAVGLNLYTSELYPTRMRAFAGAIGGAWQRVAAAVGPIVVGYLAPAYGLGAVFLYFGGLAILGGVVTYLYADETKGKTLEELSP